MSEANKLRAKLNLPPVSQIGVVVRDMDKAIEFYSSVFGIGPFNVYELVPEKYWYMGEPSHLKVLVALSRWGEIELELVQPIEGKSVHKDFLETHGEGLQHLGFVVTDYDEIFDRFIKAGFAPLLRVETYVAKNKYYLKACYFDTRKVGGVIFEIIGRIPVT